MDLCVIRPGNFGMRKSIGQSNPSGMPKLLVYELIRLEKAIDYTLHRIPLILLYSHREESFALEHQ